ncbi:hypothetical protein I7I51_04040 [Histoplasma capsulatum]|uniref:Uncharacterized protein n=1 Tax=Ajellomyces capsulatus TaxID=5037 RepID=A0A8A1MAW9_AJECA|nr:predicted protein [Histoplasma mississippiense (nom. inval.)]EDN08012.1 predicted protein [Histoplasma mississippiense (nom. inval.)]QSS61863.1 hypothetical protein I7I51_04040 [Histoplasma capsulatum]
MVLWGYQLFLHGNVWKLDIPVGDCSKSNHRIKDAHTLTLQFNKIASDLFSNNVLCFKVRRWRVPASFNKCIRCFLNIVHNNVISMMTRGIVRTDGRASRYGSSRGVDANGGSKEDDRGAVGLLLPGEGQVEKGAKNPARLDLALTSNQHGDPNSSASFHHP